MSETEQTNTRWHVGKEIPLTLLAVLAGQIFLGIWSYSALSAKVDNHERRIVSLENTDARFASEAQRISEYLARLDERMRSQTDILRRLEESLRPTGERR